MMGINTEKSIEAVVPAEMPPFLRQCVTMSVRPRASQRSVNCLLSESRASAGLPWKSGLFCPEREGWKVRDRRHKERTYKWEGGRDTHPIYLGLLHSGLQVLAPNSIEGGMG